MDLLKKEELLRKEVDQILYGKGLYDSLCKYGEVEITGSYVLKTMYKKDLDISLYNPKLSVVDFFKMGGEIAEILNPHGGFYRNTKVKFVNNRPPEAFYWGFQFADWKMDLWVVTKEHMDGSIKYAQNIINKMTEEKRRLVLEIKQKASSNYNKIYSSRELYEAIFEEDINSIEKFEKYLLSKIGCKL